MIPLSLRERVPKGRVRAVFRWRIYGIPLTLAHSLRERETFMRKS
jgi:hypothetical protein